MKSKTALLMAFLPMCAFSQAVPERIVFEYDQAGNQIYRGIVIDLTPPSNRSLLSNVEESQTATDVFGYEESKLKYYPNPVQHVLYVEWDRMYKEVISISLYTSNYQMIKQIDHLSFESQTQLYFDQLPKGSYFMVVSYQDGTKENVTIIKR